MVRYRKPDGRQTDKRGFLTKAAAEAWLQGTEVAKRKGEFIDPSLAKTRTEELCEQWFNSKIDIEQTSRDRYRMTLDHQVLPRWADVPVSAITTEDIQQWITDMDRAPSTVRKAHHALSMVLDVAVRRRMILSNPANDVNLPRLKEGEPVFLTVDQVWSLARAAGIGSDVVLFMAYSGVRWGEMAGCKVKRWTRPRLHIAESVAELSSGKLEWGDTKNHSDRTLVVPSFIADVIDRRCEGKDPDDLIFSTDRGSVIRNGNARRDWFDRAVLEVFPPKTKPKEGEKPVPSVWVTPHDLRHTAASLAIKAGGNVKAVQHMLGHKSAVMTLDLYAHLFPDDLDSVATGMEELRPAPRAVR